jgi:hypothetical protein
MKKRAKGRGRLGEEKKRYKPVIAISRARGETNLGRWTENWMEIAI